MRIFPKHQFRQWTPQSPQALATRLNQVRRPLPALRQSNGGFCIKYFELIDRFIKIRYGGEEGIEKMGIPADRAEYRSFVLKACIPDFEKVVLAKVEEEEEYYDMNIVLDLLYKMCINVNPDLEIHKVTLRSEAGVQMQAAGSKMPMVVGSPREKPVQKLQDLESRLNAQVINQTDAVSSVVRALRRAGVGLKRPEKPIGTFLFFGRTGTGKTELAKALAQELFGGGGHLIRVDCSEYANPHEYAKLIGSPPGYIGHHDGGFLTAAIRKNPNSVVLFDEIEKADSKVHNMLLQLFDEGWISDGKGARASFARAIILMTSNLGVESVDALHNRIGLSRSSAEAKLEKEAYRKAMVDAFRPEFINRIDEKIVFNNLTQTDVVKISQNLLEETKALMKAQGVTLVFAKGVAELMATLGFSETYGARELKRILKQKIEDPLAELILEKAAKKAINVRISVERGAFQFKVEKK